MNIIRKIREVIKRRKEIREANSPRRMHYYLHKTRSNKKHSRAY